MVGPRATHLSLNPCSGYSSAESLVKFLTSLYRRILSSKVDKRLLLRHRGVRKFKGDKTLRDT